MSFQYVIKPKTHGANPFKIFEELQSLDQDALASTLCQLPYQIFLGTAYWFAVSSVAKSKAGMRCQVCNSGKGIAAHHRTYDIHGREHANMGDIVVLCEYCHGLFHGNKESKFQSAPSQIAIAQPANALPIQAMVVDALTAALDLRKNVRAAKQIVGTLRVKKKGFVIPHEETDVQMPDGDPIILTKELINRCRSVKGMSFTNATLRAFGLTMPLLSGWPHQLIGKTMTRQEYRTALEGKFTYRSGPLPKITT